jgi:hypothetical protein
MKKDVTLMCVQPAQLYFAWQLEVMLTNFESLGIHKNHSIEIICAYRDSLHDNNEVITLIQKLEERFFDVAEFYFYKDTRVDQEYISSIRPNMLKQHFEAYPHLKNNAIFYHDCDIVFTEYPLFLDDPDFIQNDYNYVSDTRFYLNYDYVISKGDIVLQKMCDIVGISPALVKANNDNAGGAQYILKNIDHTFWDKVERDCRKLFVDITALNNKIKEVDPKYHELQIWCADMWAIVWNLWIRDMETKIIPELTFVWATDNAIRWNEAFIYHSAGIVAEVQDKSFFKGAFINKLPYDESGDGYNTETCVYKYFQIIKSIGANSCLIPKPETDARED